MNVIAKASRIGSKAARYKKLEKKLEKIDYELYRQSDIVQIIISASMGRDYIRDEQEREELIKVARRMVTQEMDYLLEELDKEVCSE